MLIYKITEFQVIHADVAKVSLWVCYWKKKKKTK